MHEFTYKKSPKHEAWGFPTNTSKYEHHHILPFIMRFQYKYGKPYFFKIHML